MTSKASNSEERSGRPRTGGNPAEREPERATNFVRDIVVNDVAANKNSGRVATRFPPEPNGYLHIGHAKSICLNFGLAAEFGGTCNLRFDDTNPVKEDVEYVESIQQDIRWLGFDWEDRLYYASDYFQQLYDFAVQLIKTGKAYVCSLSPEQTREYRGAFGRPGKDSPYRTRSVEENLDLFERMRAGEFEEGVHVLRAKIDMASPNMNMRDPPIFRIRKAEHHRTGDRWCIYPMYDFAHCLSDSIEGITHSICTLEFEDNRPLYDWFLDQLQTKNHPQQIEFAPLNLSFTVLSKRNLKKLVDSEHVSGWNDPRLPTLSGLRRRGYPPEVLKDFCERIGVSKKGGVVDLALLEYILREHLNALCPRVMAVLNPLRLVIDNYPEGQSDRFEIPNHPEDPGRGTRQVPFSRVVYIERDDFREDPPKKWFRLAPGKEVRLRHACLVRFERAVKDEERGEIKEIHCTWNPDSRGGNAPDGRKVPGTLHWVSAEHAFDARVRLYDRLFNVEDPLDERYGDDFTPILNPSSLTVLDGCKLEPGLADAPAGARYQFERLGYFCVDPVDSAATRPVFNRIIALRDSWAKIEKAGQNR
jgi:glutaminyl-tRNA synthetase